MSLVQHPQTPRVAICVLNWNGLSLLRTYLPSVVEHGSYPNTRIVVIDNGSEDGSIDFLKQSYPQIQLVCNNENLGFVGGYNRGLQQVSADYYVLLNSDVRVSAHWVAPVIGMMEADQRLFAVQPKILADQRPQQFEYAGAAGGCIDALGYVFCRGRFFDVCETDNGQYDQPCEVFWASGAAMFVRAACYHALGGLDERFFAHMEEIDLCWRAKRAGYSIGYCPQSVVYHLGGGSLPYGSPRKLYYNFRNNLAMLYKNLPTFGLLTALPLRLCLDVVAAAKSLLSGKTADAQAIARAVFHFLRQLPYWQQHRQHTQQLVDACTLPNAHPSVAKGKYKGSIIIDYFVRGRRSSPLLFWYFTLSLFVNQITILSTCKPF